MRKHQQKGPRAHYLIGVNKKAAEFSDRAVRRLTGAIRSRNGYYTVVEADSPGAMIRSAREYCRLVKPRSPFPPPVQKRGKITGLVAAGGDGTANALASVAIEAHLPLGILPMGRYNNIARALCETPEHRKAINAIINRKYRPVDTVSIADRTVISHFCLGLMPNLYKQLNDRKPPRFAFRWTGLVATTAEHTEPMEIIARIDAFRFEIQTRLFSLNLLSHTLGLNISPASVPDDKQAEMFFEVNCSPRDLGQYIRDVYKEKYVYIGDVRMYRGSDITLSLKKKVTALIDGELVDLPAAEIQLNVGKQKLKLFC